MSVVGTVIVYRCDGSECRKHISVSSEADLDRFGREWFVGGEFDLCGDCRFLPENRAIIRKSNWSVPLGRLQRRFAVSAKKEVKNAA